MNVPSPRQPPSFVTIHAAASNEATTTFSAALDAALTRRRMSLGALSRVLRAHGTPVSVATLSYWRSGSRQPRHARSLSAINQIEQILCLEPGALEALVAAPYQGGDPIACFPRDRDAVRALLEDLDVVLPCQEVIDREVTVKYELGADDAVRVTTTSVIESRVDGLHRHSLVVVSEDADAIGEGFEAVEGCTLGRVATDRGVTVAELLLERELAAGEIAVLEVQLTTTRRAWGDDLLYWAQRPIRTAHLLARFEPSVLPRRVETFSQIRGDEVATPAEYYASGVLHSVRGFGPGVFGIRWDRS